MAEELALADSSCFMNNGIANKNINLYKYVLYLREVCVKIKLDKLRLTVLKLKKRKKHTVNLKIIVIYFGARGGEIWW